MIVSSGRRHSLLYHQFVGNHNVETNKHNVRPHNGQQQKAWFVQTTCRDRVVSGMLR